MSVSKDISDTLVAGSLGTFGGTTTWGIYISKEPPTPDSTITIYLTGGYEPNPKYGLDYPTIQIRVRGVPQGYVDAETKAIAIKDYLLGKGGFTVNSNKYVGIWQTSDIIFLKYDDNDRPIFTLNFRIAVQPNAIGNRTALG